MEMGVGVGAGAGGDGGPWGGGSGGPCGACKFLRRKCIKESCIFAPYFESSEQGMAHFAAVHRVFGASNASKMLLQVPPHDRFDAVVSICFEAMSRVRDPVLGCVSHIFSLQQQVANLQAELAHVRAQHSLLQLLSTMPPLQPPTSSTTSNITQCSSDLDMASFCNLLAEETKDDDDDTHALVQELLVPNKYPPGAKFRSSTSQ